MKLDNISKEELEAMNYDDIAYIILNEKNEKMKINTLFKKVCEALDLTDDDFVNKIADFFELLTTDKRFIMLEDGYWDLKERHNPKIIIDEDEEEDSITEETEEEIKEENEEEEKDIFYDTESDDDIPDDDLEDLVVIDVDEDEANS